MASLNKKRPQIKTHEGGVAKHINPELALRRSVMSCLLWEKEFYEDGTEIHQRIASLIPLIDPVKVAKIAVEARTEMNLRHVPLAIVREMARLPNHKGLVAHTLRQVIQRPDELCEFVSMYWKDGKAPLSGQVKKGLARAFVKFNAYQLGKYNNLSKAVKLRDVLFLCHAKPQDAEQEKTWKALVEGTLESPDTWEVSLSAGKDKKETFERLMKEDKLGGLALLRNLRNMEQAGVESSLLKKAIKTMNVTRILPYRFIAAARYAPNLEPLLEERMIFSLTEAPKLPGKTCLLVDVSGSMDHALSTKSDLTRLDAACGLAILLREICEEVYVRTFSDNLYVLPPRQGFALRDAIVHSQPHGSTYLGGALEAIKKNPEKTEKNYDRMIVITDEQSHDKVADPVWEHSYMVNVASAKNGVGYGAWHHIDGFSEAIVRYVQAYEKTE